MSDCGDEGDRMVNCYGWCGNNVTSLVVVVMMCMLVVSGGDCYGCRGGCGDVVMRCGSVVGDGLWRGGGKCVASVSGGDGKSVVVAVVVWFGCCLDLQ